MKKFGKKGLALFLATLMVGSTFAFTSCGDDPGNGDTPPSADEELSNEKIDTSREQIFVFNFNGGYGSQWILNLKNRFEEEMAEEEFPNGKVGVQVIVDNIKQNAHEYKNSIKTSRSQIFFTEYANYYELKGAQYDAFYDMTEWVTSEIGYNDETESIVDKLNDQQREYYNMGSDDEPAYYGIPHYAGFDGLVYDRGLFEEKGWLLVDKGAPGVQWDDDNIYSWFKGQDDRSPNYTARYSAGPDCEFDTYDDGLPTTYAEFYGLINYIVAANADPFVWNGFAISTYIQFMMYALAVNQEGVEQSMLNYTLDGTATSLGTIQGGEFVEDDDDTEINNENGLIALSRQKGRYYSAKFVENMFSAENYYYEDSFKPSFSHTMAQQEFVYAKPEGARDIAMLVDGCWWESEATNEFYNCSVEFGEEWGKYGENRDFRWMPLPKVDAETVEADRLAKEEDPDYKHYTLLDSINSLCFANKATVSNLDDWQKDLLGEFVKFAHTDESLIEFTTTTNTLKSFEYTLDDDAKEEMTGFGRSLVDLREDANVVYPFSENEVFLANQQYFAAQYFYGNEFASNKLYGNEMISVEDYFENIEAYWDGEWETMLSRAGL